MSKLDKSYRVAASALFLMAAVGPFLAWGTYLFGGNYSNWRGLLESALSAENEFRFFFVLRAIGGLFSLVSAIIVAVQRRHLLLLGVIVGGIVQTLAYAVVGAWFLSFVAASPLWFAYKVEHEV
jgi:hypothetical protein